MAGIAASKCRAKWPDSTIRQLAQRADGLFIWAETACKFIEKKGTNTETRLTQILSGTQSAEGSKPLDALYTTAITLGMGDLDEEGLDNVRRCIGVIIATASRTPLSVSNLELLMRSSQIPPGVFGEVVNGLGSVLYEDDSQGGAVRVCHPSFADFIVNQARSNKFYVDLGDQNATLAECCLRTMIEGLRFNICDLKTSHILNRDVVDLEVRAGTAIGQALKYSCLHWCSHLIQAPKVSLKDPLGTFLYGTALLYWIEALSLLARLEVSLSSLLSLVTWTSVSVS